MKKFIIALSFFVYAGSVTIMASDLSGAKHDLKSAQRELSSATAKRDKAQKKQTQLQANYEETLAKAEKNQDKPQSLAYKNAVKKSEELTSKMEQNTLLLDSLDHQIDSLQNVVRICESALNQAQQEKAEEKEARKQAAAEKKSAKAEKETTAEYPVYNLSDPGPIKMNEDKEQKTISVSEPTEKTISDKKDGGSGTGYFLIAIFVALGVIGILFDRPLRCPRCGKWFSYRRTGVKVLNKERAQGGKGWDIVYEKTFTCKHCGHVKTKRGTHHSSKKTLPNDWYC